mgnify:CR=1 FL=1
MEKKKKLIILGVILLLIIVSGATFAILTWNSTMIKLGINTNCFTIDYTRGGDITGSLKLLNINELFAPPLEGSDNPQFTIKKGMGLSYVNVGINSNCSIEGYGTIYLNVTELSDTFKDGGESSSALSYAVLKNTSNLSNSDITIDNLENQSFEVLNIQPIMETGKIELYSEQLSNTEVNKYLVVIFVDKLSAGNDVTEATFKGNISVEAEQKKYGETPSYCFNLADKDEENKTASLATMGYNCYAGNNNNYETITDVVIPSTIDGYKITKINDGFNCQNYKYNSAAGRYGCSQGNKILKIMIPDSVIGIGDFAFYYNQLTNVVIPNSVVTIGNYSFMGNQLTTINISNSAVTIGELAFHSNLLTSISLPDSVTEIRNYAFSDNNLNYVYIGSDSNLTSIGSGAFTSSTNSNPNLRTIYYNGSNSLPWIYAVNGSASSTKFVTGTVPSYTSGTTTYNEVLITTGK